MRRWGTGGREARAPWGPAPPPSLGRDSVRLHSRPGASVYSSVIMGLISKTLLGGWS